LLNAIYAWYKLKHYAQQGMPTAFWPLLGQFWPLAVGIHKFNTGAQKSTFTQYVQAFRSLAKGGKRMAAIGGYTTVGGWGMTLCVINDEK